MMGAKTVFAYILQTEDRYSQAAQKVDSAQGPVGSAASLLVEFTAVSGLLSVHLGAP